MQKPFVLANLGLLFFSSFALVQSSAQAPPTQPAAGQLTPQMLGEMLRSATTFNDLVRNLNLNKTFGPDQHVQGPDGRLRHPVERTAQTIGAGVGAGGAGAGGGGVGAGAVAAEVTGRFGQPARTSASPRQDKRSNARGNDLDMDILLIGLVTSGWLRWAQRPPG